MNPNLTRTFTAPMPSHPKLHSSTSYPHGTGSHYSLNSQPSTYRSSGSTQNTSNSTLSSIPTSAGIQGNAAGAIGASDNVINRVADQNASLFQICVALRARLSGVPGFEEQILQVEEEHQEGLDPVMLLWHTFRRGDPLLMIYNALNPKEPLYVDKEKVTPAKRAEVAAYKFLQACINKLKFPMEECYMITDLKTTNDNKDINMGGFAKVVRVVSRVVDILVRQGVLVDGGGHEYCPPGSAMPKRTHRQHVVDELVRTERTYVQHLELLQLFSTHVKQSNAVSGDAIIDIFLNLDVLLEFQRRFLVRVEQTNAQPEEDQNWGRLFYAYAQPSSNPEKDFRVYEPYIENQKRCEEAAMREFEKLKSVGGSMELRQMVESPTHFTSFLLKPFQRLSKYPLLLKELRDKGDLPEDCKFDLTQGIDAVTAILNTTNASIDREEKTEAVRALKSQVEDWKSHRVEAFGNLLLYGTYTVLKGDPARQEEREYRMYLFEKILLCCKEINPNKPKNKIRSASTAPDRRGRPRLQLKGRIFMQNVTETIVNSRQGYYTCQIYWRGDEAIESFAIRFNTEELLKKWRDKIEGQRQVCSDKMSNFQNTSETEFTYLRGQTHLENPYREDDLADDDPDAPSLAYTESSDLPMSRNGSNTSLRSRSTTNESLQQPRSRPPMGAGGLSVRTQTSAASPMDRNGTSYFSPSVDSPATMSSRTSTSSNIFPYPRQGQPPNGYHREEPNRFTAPAMDRGSQGNIYQPEGRTGSSSSYSSSYQSRYRSASNPDMQNAPKQRGTTTHPPVPSIPAHVQQNAQGVNRSPNSSPFSPRRAPPSSEQNPYSHSYQYGAENAGYDRYDGTSGQEHGQARFQPQDGTTMSPPLGPAASTNEPMTPSQLKVKVKVPSEGSNLTLIVGFNISYQSLRDRIDAKLQRNTSVSLATGSVQLKYLYDDEYVKIQNDEDVQTAFETWREQQQDDFVGPLGEIELYCLTAG